VRDQGWTLQGDGGDRDELTALQRGNLTAEDALAGEEQVGFGLFVGGNQKEIGTVRATNIIETIIKRNAQTFLDKEIFGADGHVEGGEGGMQVCTLIPATVGKGIGKGRGDHGTTAGRSDDGNPIIPSIGGNSTIIEMTRKRGEGFLIKLERRRDTESEVGIGNVRGLDRLDEMEGVPCLRFCTTREGAGIEKTAGVIAQRGVLIGTDAVAEDDGVLREVGATGEGQVGAYGRARHVVPPGLHDGNLPGGIEEGEEHGEGVRDHGGEATGGVEA